MNYILPLIRKYKMLSVVYFLMLLLSFHYYLIIYMNSSFLHQYADEKIVGLLFTAGSLINIVIFFKISWILKKFGNYITALGAVIIEALAITGLIFADSLLLVAPLFIIHQAIITVILFNLDEFLESYAPEESTTGEIRGLFLTVSNIALVISPFVAGIILGDNRYGLVYLASLLFLIPIYIIIRRTFSNFSDSIYRVENISTTVKEIWNNSSVRYVYAAHLVLQFYYAWMVIYTGIYLTSHIGFSWEIVGGIFSIMLLPFIIFEIPVGALADRKWGEKELMVAGFFVLGIATMAISLITTQNIAAWASILFLTRVGASIVEVTTESYFFKHVAAGDSNIISFFRITRPLSFIFAPLVVAAVLVYTDLGLAFILLGTIALCGALFAMNIKDTR